MTFKPMLEPAGLAEMQERHSIQIATTSSSSLIGAPTGTQVAQLGAGLTETTSLTSMGTLEELAPRGKSQLVTWGQEGRLLEIRWQESQWALQSQQRWQIIPTQRLITSWFPTWTKLKRLALKLQSSRSICSIWWTTAKNWRTRFKKRAWLRSFLHLLHQKNTIQRPVKYDPDTAESKISWKALQRGWASSWMRHIPKICKLNETEMN